MPTCSVACRSHSVFGPFSARSHEAPCSWQLFFFLHLFAVDSLDVLNPRNSSVSKKNHGIVWAQSWICASPHLDSLVGEAARKGLLVDEVAKGDWAAFVAPVVLCSDSRKKMETTPIHVDGSAEEQVMLAVRQDARLSMPLGSQTWFLLLATTQSSLQSGRVAVTVKNVLG